LPENLKCLTLQLKNKLTTMTQTLWGIDLGGTKTEGVILKSSHDPQVVRRLRIPTESSKGYHHIISRISKVVQMLTEESGITPQIIGIGTPGTLDPITQTLKNSNTVCLNGMPFKKDLEQALQLPVITANDANCFALAEARMGAVQDVLPHAEVVFGVIMGTGVGGGIVVNGKVLNGRQGIGGEWGHNFLDASGGVCYCGKSGCVETVIAGPSLQKFYQSLGGQPLSLPEIVKNYYSGNDPYANDTIQRLLEQFGLAVSVVINILDPDVIVLGGGVGNIDLLYTEGIKEVKKHVFNNRMDTLFLKPKLGDSAGVFGAAMLTASAVS
jgi:predicted NBD/HSP70 family sugar kinase